MENRILHVFICSSLALVTCTKSFPQTQPYCSTCTAWKWGWWFTQVLQASQMPTTKRNCVSLLNDLLQAIKLHVCKSFTSVEHVYILSSQGAVFWTLYVLLYMWLCFRLTCSVRSREVGAATTLSTCPLLVRHKSIGTAGYLLWYCVLGNGEGGLDQPGNNYQQQNM